LRPYHVLDGKAAESCPRLFCGKKKLENPRAQRLKGKKDQDLTIFPRRAR